ncbi:MAG: class I SAM-dependent methyltransferase [Chitinophagaceae bacterium]|nr:class I SAM-dependent methyltransferase [Chitinophagaceae bacterium]
MKLTTLLVVIFCYGMACGQQPADTSYVYKSPSRDGIGKFYFGREIARIMDASGSDWLERPQRSQQENTDEIVKSMQLEPSTVVADVGAGTGYYTFRISQLVPDGKVYAVEIQDELITKLNDKKSERNISNVEVIRGDTTTTNLPSSSVDMALMVDVYHELSWPREIIRSIVQSLKPGGRLVLVEYKGEDPSVAIKPLHKTTVAQLTRELSSMGLKLERRVDTFPIQHFLVFKRS